MRYGFALKVESFWARKSSPPFHLTISTQSTGNWRAKERSSAAKVQDYGYGLVVMMVVLARTTSCFTSPGIRSRIAFDRLEGQLTHSHLSPLRRPICSPMALRCPSCWNMPRSSRTAKCSTIFASFRRKRWIFCSCEGRQESCHFWSSERMTRQPGSSSKIGLLPKCPQLDRNRREQPRDHHGRRFIASARGIGNSRFKALTCCNP